MRYPIIRQTRPHDCGPACLAMLFAFYGKRQPAAAIRQEAGTGVRGTSLAGLARAARKFGFVVRGVRSTTAGLGQVELPAIAHWLERERYHYVVLYEFGTAGATIGDPAGGIRRVSPDRFQECWTGVLLLLRPNSDTCQSGSG